MIDQEQHFTYGDRLKNGEKFNTVLISNYLGIPEVVTGFILSKIGAVVSGEWGKRGAWSLGPTVIERIDRRLSTDLKGGSLALYDRGVQNPDLLQKLIAGSDLDPAAKRQLRRLALHSEIYRRYPLREWWRAGNDLKDSHSDDYDFYNNVAAVLLSLADFPWQAYETCQKYLIGLLDPNHPGARMMREKIAANVGIAKNRTLILDESILNIDDIPVTARVPVFKSLVTEPDRLEEAEFDFNLGLISILRLMNVGIVVGGSPHSGKSTFVASLYRAMEDLVKIAEGQGVVEQGKISIGKIDLDVSAPTQEYIDQGVTPAKNRGVPWEPELVDKTRRSFRVAIGDHNVTLGDLPGGKPDYYTYSLASPAHFSIVLDRDYQESMLMWQDYLLGVNLPPPLVAAHSRFKEEGRTSGIRTYSSTARRRPSKRDFLGGRVVDLDLRLVEDNPFINFAALVLLSDFLPHSFLRKEQYKRMIRESLTLA